jgi:uncharacterized repeat protein (TIGR01451 family)
MTITISSASMFPSRDPLFVSGRWCMIAVAVLILCSCRGLESTTRGPAAAAPVTEIGSTDMPEVSAVAQRTAPVTAAEPQVARLRSVPTQQSLSDLPDTAGAPAPWATQVAPAGHSAPAARAAGTFGPQVRGPWCSPTAAPQMVPVSPGPPMVPPCASCGPEQMPCGEETGCPNGLPCGAWTPPGLPCPWPDDEYLCDGGDQSPAVRVRKDWRVDGLQLEDTVVHYDTAAGDTYVQPTNRVCLYAPRFAAVRKVYGIVQHDGQERLTGMRNPVPLEGLDDVEIATTTVQPLQPGLNLGTTAPSGFRERTPPTGLENSQGLIGAHGGLLPYEDFTLIRRGLMENSEKARLAERTEAAVVWSHDTAVQVLIDNVALQEDVGVAEAESLHIYSREGKPRLQVCKIASRKEARPGENVEFTIRLDNLGDQIIGNVTVIDNLTTRLEYVEGSQSCTLQANFAMSDNQGDSLTLRWELVEPMKVGEGGVIRFQCRVR